MVIRHYWSHFYAELHISFEWIIWHFTRSSCINNRRTAVLMRCIHVSALFNKHFDNFLHSYGRINDEMRYKMNGYEIKCVREKCFFYHIELHKLKPCCQSSSHSSHPHLSEEEFQRFSRVLSENDHISIVFIWLFSYKDFEISKFFHIYLHSVPPSMPCYHSVCWRYLRQPRFQRAPWQHFRVLCVIKLILVNLEYYFLRLRILFICGVADRQRYPFSLNWVSLLRRNVAFR